MLLKEPLPASIKKALNNTINADERIISVVSDIDHHQHFGTQWLVATAHDLLILSPNGSGATVIRKQRVKDLLEVKVESNVGNSFLEATLKNGQVIHLIHYSGIHSTKFAAAAKWLTQLARGEALSPVTEEGPQKCPSCGMLLPEDSNVCPRCIQRKRVLMRLLHYLKPHKGITFFVALLNICNTGINLIPPYLTRILVDDVLTAKNNNWLALIVLGLLGLSLMGILIRILTGRITAWLGSRISYEIRDELFAKTQQMNMHFFDKHKTGTLMSRVERDTRDLQELLAFELPFFIVNATLIIGIGTIMLYMNWQLALLTLLPMPVVVLFTASIWNRVYQGFRRVFHHRARLSAVVNDVFSGIRVVKGFAQEPRELNRFNQKSHDVFQVNVFAEQNFATFLPILNFIWGTGTLIVWYFGGRNVMNEQMSLGTLIAFIAFLGMFYGPLHVVTRFWDWITRSIAAAERIFEILDTPTESEVQTTTTRIPQIKGKVVFDQVTFGYQRHNPVLHNINLAVEAGEMIGLVGHSGAGKTTITNLICRFYTVDEGVIYIDGKDINTIHLEDLRKQIGVVLQEPYLFHGTIAENIGYAKPGVTIDEIIQAAQIANAHDFIVKFPDGYDTNVSERGQRLSGGERQRISIARAVLHDPRILILDEATSMVDTETERKIQEALARLVKGRTTFAIAHRLSTLRNADRLLVLEDGKPVEMGTHSELMAKKGAYFKMVKLQKEMSKIKAVDG